MRQSIEMATGAAMEQIVKSDTIKSHIGGRMGQIVKSTVNGAFIAAAMMASMAPAAHAESCLSGGGVLGAVAGGFLGHTIGHGAGNTVATAAGAVIGCNVGDTVQRNSEYRQQQQAGYAPGAVVMAPAYGGRFAQPAVAPNGPMGNYMAHTFRQLDGVELPTHPLDSAGTLAMEKVVSQAEQAARVNFQAQQDYANTFEQRRQAAENARNPEAIAIMGAGQANAAAYRLDGQLNQASQRRNQTNMAFGSAGMQMADLVEFEAAKGADITGYKERLLNVMKAPMSAAVTGMDPSTHQQVTFTTGVGSAAAVPVAYQRAPGF